MKVRAGDREDELARRDRAHEVDHHRAASERERRQRLARDRAHVRLELARVRALDREVPGVVHARRDLVREQLALAIEELERQHAHVIELHEQA